MIFLPTVNVNRKTVDSSGILNLSQVHSSLDKARQTMNDFFME